MAIGDFSQQADAYRQARPGYPDGLLDRLTREAGLTTGDPVIEFGAGTGLLTTLLTARGFRVIATEPNPAMSAQADRSDVMWLTGTFEDCPAPNASQLWAVAAQAFHWAEPTRAFPEIHRVLQPEGVFSILWNNRAVRDCEVVKWTEEAIRRQVPEFDEAYRDRPWDEVLESTGHFAMLSTHVEQHTVPMSTERYQSLWRSHNRLNNIAGPERFSAFFTELTTYLQTNGIEQIDVIYTCEAWSAQRVSA